MQNFFDVDDNILSSSLRETKHLMISHGWKDVIFIQGGQRFFIGTRPDGQRISFASCAAPTTNAFGTRISEDKLSTYYLLKELGVSQAYTLPLSNDVKSARKQLQDLIQKYSKIVIKPSDGAHGNHVYTDISDLPSALQAYKNTSLHSKKVLAQQQLESTSPEVRVFCVNYQFVAAFSRIPAHVTGDGRHAVKELIKIENSTIRTAPYQSNLSFIDESMSSEYITKQGIADYVPTLGETVQVIRMCNIGRGGTNENISDIFPPKLKKLSEKIAKKFELPIIGIDFLGENVLEVNSQPSSYYPTGDASASICVEKYVDYLEHCNLSTS